MTTGQYSDPKLAPALMEFCTRSYVLQNCALTSSFWLLSNIDPGIMIGGGKSDNGWIDVVLGKDMDADSASSSGRKGALKYANTLDMSNVSYCALLDLRGSMD